MMFNQDWMVDVLAKATVILIVASVTDCLITRRPAAIRHRLWSTTLLMLLIFPISSAIMPQWHLPILPRSWSNPIATSPAVPNRSDASIQIIGDSSSSQLGTSNLGDQDGSTPRSGNLDSLAISSTIHPADALDTEPSISALRPFESGLILFWVIGFFLAISPLFRGFAAMARIRRSSTRLTDRESIDRLAELRSRLGIHRTVEVLVTDGAMIPMTFGWLRPVIVVPLQWHGWAIETQRIVMLHELAHIKRFDAAYQMAARIACSLYWFHPLAWYGLRRLRMERELACDDCVLNCGENPASYAKQLLDIARQFHSLALPPTVAMAQGSHGLESRIRAILDRTRVRLPVDPRLTRTLLATSLVVFALLATVRLDATAQVVDKASPSQPSDDQESGTNAPKDDASKDEAIAGQLIKELAIQVVDDDGNPIAGAKVNPWALQSSQGHGGWADNLGNRTKMLPEAVLTGQDGMATIKYPFYGDVTERVRTTGVSITVSHPHFTAPEDSIHINDLPRDDSEVYKVELKKGVVLKLLPTINGKPAVMDNLFTMWSETRSHSARAKPEKTQPGTLRLPPMRAGKNSVLIAVIENDRATHFSALTDLTLSVDKQDVVEIPLVEARLIEGKLSDNVPRPIRKGRVALLTLPPADANNMRVEWFTWVPVRADGGFTIHGWPPGEAIQAIALCDGYIGESGEAPKEAAGPKRNYQNRPQVFREGDTVEIQMTPMVDWLITAVDEGNQPVSGIEIHSSPNIHWWNGGSQIYAGSLARSEVFIQKPSDLNLAIDDARNPFRGTTDVNGKTTIQLPTGNQRLAVHNSDAYELPAFLGRRRIRIESKPDQANEVTLYLQSKGTDKLGEWDKLASVVLGYSAAERRRISALPEVREKMDAFAKQFRNAKTRRGPKVLAEAYTVVAEALAHAGDLKEASKWHRKAAEQKAKANHQP